MLNFTLNLTSRTLRKTVDYVETALPKAKTSWRAGWCNHKIRPTTAKKDERSWFPDRDAPTPEDVLAMIRANEFDK